VVAVLTRKRGRGEMKISTDLDLAPIHRTQANYWQARYFEAYRELVNANKGLRRLRRKLDTLKPPDVKAP